MGFGFGLAGMLAAFASCTDSYRDDLSSSSSGQTTGSGSSTENNPTGFGNGGESCNDVCANDLKRVVDCFGKEVTKCTADQACLNAKCVDNPCEAARESKSSYGCDYWALKTAQRTQAEGACFAAVVANTWEKPVSLTVHYGTDALDPATFAYIPKAQGADIDYQPYDPVAGLPPGEVAILFLSRGSGGLLDCPKPAAMATDTGVQDPTSKHAGTGRGKAFHIETNYPSVAYQIAPYGGGKTSFSAATLLLPTSAWDTNYLAVNAYKASAIEGGGWPSLNILAYKDNTKVTIQPKVDIVGGTDVAAAPKGMSADYTLNAGEFLQITQAEELTGSPILATEPIAVFGGADCMTVPVETGYCDSAQQQLAPVKAIGNEYAAVRYRDRVPGKPETVPWRLVGMTEGTALTWVGESPPTCPRPWSLARWSSSRPPTRSSSRARTSITRSISAAT